VRKKSATLTPQELEIMKVVWPAGRATVREVHEELSRRRDVAKTTVQTMMNLLEAKGHLAKTPGPDGQVYKPSRPRQQVVRGMVREFVTRVFDGSARPLLTHLLKDSSLTERERSALQRLLEDGE
jgi:BlaI family transcriptional regulator, penicillinase repressor